MANSADPDQTASEQSGSTQFAQICLSKYKYLGALQYCQAASLSASRWLYLRNQFHFSDVHQSMNAVGPVQIKCLPKGVMLTLLVTHCVLTSMNVRKMKFISYIYTLFVHCFCSLFVKFRCKSCKISCEEKL